jgi:galactokinase
MDQSASVYGNVIRFDGSNLTSQLVNAELGDFEFILANSNVVRELGTSSYPIRVKEVEKAAIRLAANGWPGLSKLGQVQRDELDRATAALDDETLARRLRHVVTESERVAQAESALSERAWIRFGELMTAGGRSSATDYEVSHPTVERLVSACIEAPGVFGARMMGGGDGGSILALIDRSAREDVIEHLDRAFYQAEGGPDAHASVLACAFDRGYLRDQA